MYPQEEWQSLPNFWNKNHIYATEYSLTDATIMFQKVPHGYADGVTIKNSGYIIILTHLLKMSSILVLNCMSTLETVHQ